MAKYVVWQMKMRESSVCVQRVYYSQEERCYTETSGLKGRIMCQHTKWYHVKVQKRERFLPAGVIRKYLIVHLYIH